MLVDMGLLRISAVTLLVKDMHKSYCFYSKVPGFNISFFTDKFITFTLDGDNGSKTHLNLELKKADKFQRVELMDFGRIIFHVDSVDALHLYFKSDVNMLRLITIEKEPENAPWGERYFHIRDPDGYQISFAEPIK
jgi:catechol 2,3-dioxygenase-like lactoylglutathione lyase family enzyme